jgi:FtsZ-binding cell division protein ZapB
MMQKQITLAELYRMIVELKEENQSTQKAVANLRGEITNLYSLYEKHSCYQAWE